MRSRNRESRRPQQDQLTPEDMEIALSFLKKRFNEYTLDEILLSLVQHVQRNDNRQLDFFSDQDQQESFDRDKQGTRLPQLPLRTRITHKNRDQRQLRENISSLSVNNQEKLQKSQEMRMVAKFFCQTGVNYNLVRYFFPQMTPQQYRSYIQAINNQTINEIQKFLRYQCNIQIEHISTDQKRSLKNQLIKVRDWLGQKSVSQLETYYKFIQRQYEHKSVEVSYDQALKLYKTLLQIIKSPFVDIMEIVDDQDSQIPQIQSRAIKATKDVPIGSFTKQEEKRAVSFVLKYKNIDKVIQKLNSTFGQNSKWTKNALSMIIKHSIKRALKKIVLSKHKYLRKGPVIYFGTSSSEVDKIFEAPNLKESILTFYLVSRTTMTQLSRMIAELNAFFNNNHDSAEIELISSDDQCSIVPKIESLARLQRSQEQLPNNKELKQEQVSPIQNLNANFQRQSEEESEPQVKQDPELDRQTAVGNYEEFIQID